MRHNSNRWSWPRFLSTAATSLVFIVSGIVQAEAQTSLSSYLRDVVSYHAPIIIAETANSEQNPEVQDHLLPVDLDGDNSAANNAQSVRDGVVTSGLPTAYFSIVETGTSANKGYFFINYYFYHAQDGGVHFKYGLLTISAHGHDNDMEGVALIVKKSFYAPYGTVVAAYSEAHGALIPWINPNATSPGAPAGGGISGYIRFWHDGTFDVFRPVVAIRSAKHGTFMAQDCSGQTEYFDLPWPGAHYGMWLNSPQLFGTYRSCIHDDSQAITYVPVPLSVPPSSGIGATRLGPTVRTGTRWYQLQELATTSLWHYRSQYGTFLSGNVINMSGGNTGLDAFSADPANDDRANPPWQWRGGPGKCFSLVVFDACWYSFGRENTSKYADPANWPTAPNNGWVVTSPAAEAALRFPSLPEISEPVRYNPYLASPPACCSSYPFEGVIAGPTAVTFQTTAGWTAEIGGGTPPYTYQWSGLASGSTQSIHAFVDSPGTLFLDVYDAAQRHLALSVYVDLVCPPAATFADSAVVTASFTLSPGPGCPS